MATAGLAGVRSVVMDNAERAVSDTDPTGRATSFEWDPGVAVTPHQPSPR